MKRAKPESSARIAGAAAGKRIAKLVEYARETDTVESLQAQKEDIEGDPRIPPENKRNLLRVANRMIAMQERKRTETERALNKVDILDRYSQNVDIAHAIDDLFMPDAYTYDNEKEKYRIIVRKQGDMIQRIVTSLMLIMEPEIAAVFVTRVLNSNEYRVSPRNTEST